jgi:NAD(P)-dependent dehydrogenase (short-subunit alcohol dehydrogenase family)
MDGKVIVITGALGALGQVVLETAVTRGARVAGVDHAKSEVAATNSRLEIGGVDLTDEHAARTAIEAVAGHFGRIDALVNIAGGFAF